MAGKYIAVEGCTIQVKSPASGTVSITSSPSTGSKIDQKGVYRGPLSFSVSNVMQAPDGTATPGTATGTIQPTASKDTVDHQAVIRAGDKAEGVVAADAMRPGSSGSPEPSPITFSVEITDAGQSKVQGE